MEYLSMDQIEALRQYDTPTVCNAIERFEIRPRTDGFMDHTIKCILPYPKPFVGYAATAKISASTPPTPEQGDLWMEYFAYLQKTPRPAFAVIEDTDEVPVGSFWGEVNATTQKALGACGVITNGGVRDLTEVEELGFGLFATCILTSHAYVHIEQYSCPVTIGGVTVRPGDLLHADRHGVALIPYEIAPLLAEQCRLAGEAELPVISGCRRAMAEGREVDLEQLREWRGQMSHLRFMKKD